EKEVQFSGGETAEIVLSTILVPVGVGISLYNTKIHGHEIAQLKGNTRSIYIKTMTESFVEILDQLNEHLSGLFLESVSKRLMESAGMKTIFE
ncbi:hypothetical protein PENTCL1PPCAC_15632, partial [Pristionchus entomophagus]